MKKIYKFYLEIDNTAHRTAQHKKPYKFFNKINEIDHTV